MKHIQQFQIFGKFLTTLKKWAHHIFDFGEIVYVFPPASFYEEPYEQQRSQIMQWLEKEYLPILEEQRLKKQYWQGKQSTLSCKATPRFQEDRTPLIGYGECKQIVPHYFDPIMFDILLTTDLMT